MGGLLAHFGFWTLMYIFFYIFLYVSFLFCAKNKITTTNKLFTCWSLLSALSWIWGMLAMEAATHCSMLLSWGSRVKWSGPHPVSFTSKFTMSRAVLETSSWVRSTHSVPAWQWHVITSHSASHLHSSLFFCCCRFCCLFCFFLRCSLPRGRHSECCGTSTTNIQHFCNLLITGSTSLTVA